MKMKRRSFLKQLGSLLGLPFVPKTAVAGKTAQGGVMTADVLAVNCPQCISSMTGTNKADPSNQFNEQVLIDMCDRFEELEAVV